MADQGPSLDSSIWAAHVPPLFRFAGNATTHNLFLCNDPAGWGPFDRNLAWTSCFLEGIVLNIPSIISLLLVTGQTLLRITSGKRVASARSKREYILALSIIVQIILWSWSIKLSTPALSDITSLFTVLGLLIVLIATWQEPSYTNIPSSSLLIYWLAFTAAQALDIFSVNGTHTSVARTLFGLSCFSFIVEWYTQPEQYINLDLNDTRRDNPYDQADIFSRLTFTWMTPLMKRGYEHFLTMTALPPLPSDDRADHCFEEFDRQWRRQCNRTNGGPSLYRALFGAFGFRFLIGNLCKVVQDCLAFVQPQLLRLLIAFVEKYQKSNGKESLTGGFYISIAMFATSLCQTAFLHQYFDRAFGTGMRAKSALTNAIFQKALRLSVDARNQKSIGDTVNLMSIDTQRLQDLFPYGHIVWSGPFQIILCLISLHNLLGQAMWAGVIIMLVFIPINSYLAKKQKNFQERLMRAKDERTNLTNELLSNIKSIKLYAWELPFTAKLNYVRLELEIAALKSVVLFQSFTSFLWAFAPFLVSLSTFVLYTVLNKDTPLTADKIFPAIALFNLLNFPLAMFPQFMSGLIEANVASGRITEFLQCEELQKGSVSRLPRQTELGQVAVKLENASFAWSKGSEPMLKGINLEVKKGELVCVVGRVGSGKTTLLSGILEDIYLKKGGSVQVHGSVAYVSQSPWIFNGTVRENILFGFKYDEVIYNQTIKACALLSDFAVLPDGDATLVGEKGISLSGGQKSRLALARAVYSRADVYLLDDPLSAVDEHVGKHIISNVLSHEGLLASKAILLATNSLPVLRNANTIAMLDGHRICEQGEYEAILTSPNESPLRALFREFGRKGDNSSSRSTSQAPSRRSSVSSSTTEHIQQLHDSRAPSRRNSLRRASVSSWRVEPPVETRKEHVEQGKVSWDVYKEYVRVCGPLMVLLVIVTMCTSGGLSVLSNVWLKHWADSNDKGNDTHPVSFYLSIYALIGVLFCTFTAVQQIAIFFGAALKAAKTLHDRMLEAVVRAPMSFFETTPIGRIINRFSNDIYKIDQQLPRSLSQLIMCIIRVVYTIIVVSSSTPAFLLLVVPLFFVYYHYQKYYLHTSRELKRLESVSKSPIYAQFQETLDGITTVRAYNQTERFNFMNQGYIDTNNKAYFPGVSANRWLAVRLEFIGSFIILSAATFSVWSLPFGHISAGSIGLALSYALNITQTLNWVVRMSVEAETNIVSVERVLEYCDIKPEAPLVVPDHRPPEGWPAHGAISINDYSCRYRPELPLVLKHVNLDIKPGEKLGIVGRTGSGKSTLTLALFRLVEPSEGHFEIDSVNTSDIGLFDLRSHLSIIPQDSQLFSGTIRSNLDPAGRWTDTEIWRALELSHLKHHVEKMPGKLDAPVRESGNNLSGGQRQLIALARAMLTETNVLVLDEATAAVDVETDKLVQKTIRKEFQNRTILTVAHRLNTIMDSDRILVLSYGEVVELGPPDQLLKNTNGAFYSLAKEGGLV